MILQLFAIDDDKLNNFSFNHADQVDEYGKSVGDFQVVQTNFDSRAEELRLKHNALIDTLKAIGAAGEIGAVKLQDGVSLSTVQAELAYLLLQIQNVILDQIPDNSLTEDKMAAEMKKQAGGVLPYDIVGDSFYSRLLEWYGNTKIVDNGQDVSNWTPTVGTVSADVSNFKLGKQSIRNTVVSTSSGAIGMYGALSSLDLTKLENGEDSGDNDFVTIPFYISDASFFTAISFYITDSPTGDVTNSALKTFTSGYTTGWNYFKIQKLEFALQGTFDWTDVQSIRTQVNHNVNADGEYTSLQYTQLVKKDPTLAIPNAFQRNGNLEFIINTGEWFVGKEYDELVAKEISGVGNARDALESVKTYSEPIASVSFGNTDANNKRALNLVVDGSNYLRISIENDVARLLIAEPATTQIDKPYPVELNDLITLTLEKKGTNVLATVTRNNDPSTSILITGTTILTDDVKLGVANLVNDTTTYNSLSITDDKHSYHSTVSEVSKRTEAIRIDKTELTIPNSWVASGDSDFPFKIDFDIDGVLETDDVTLVPVLGSSNIAKTAGIAEQTIEYNGGVTVYAVDDPGTTVGVIATILKR